MFKELNKLEINVTYLVSFTLGELWGFFLVMAPLDLTPAPPPLMNSPS